jgi:phage shock protein PspC (stress-responsive transcriptional regulator)
MELNNDDAAKTDRKLVRSRNNRMIAGVCGGFAEYYGWTPWVVRFIYVLVSIFSAAFPGILVYLLLWLLMPKSDPPIDRS